MRRDQALEIIVRRIARVAALAAAMCLACVPASAQWQAKERTEFYQIRGETGAELYFSIGDNGPKIALGRTIALTDFKLTWTRDYQPRDGGCVLASALPKVIITYKLPRPANSLPAPVRKSWEAFIVGVEKHERVHGELIKKLVHDIEAVSVGLSEPNDPDCTRIREMLTAKLAVLSQAQRRQSSDFDRMEMSEGGNIHQLILALVNGP